MTSPVLTRNIGFVEHKVRKWGIGSDGYMWGYQIGNDQTGNIVVSLNPKFDL